MNSFLRIIVTGLIAQDSLTGGFLEHGFIKLTEDRPTTIGLPRTAPSTLPVFPHHAFQPGRRPSLRAPAEVWFSISDSQRKQILNFADLLVNLSGIWNGEKNTGESAGSHTSTAIRCSRKSSWNWERRAARYSPAQGGRRVGSSEENESERLHLRQQSPESPARWPDVGLPQLVPWAQGTELPG